MRDTLHISGIKAYDSQHNLPFTISWKYTKESCPIETFYKVKYSIFTCTNIKEL